MWQHGRMILTALIVTALLPLGPESLRAQTQDGSGPEERDGQGDFDFEFGIWDARVSRLVRPLSGSDEWVVYEGTSTVHPLWNGRANVGELRVDGPAGSILGMSLRLYDPAARQWHIRWANSRDGAMGPPMIGEFRDGRGEFYNQELFDGRAIFVRFIFSDITRDSFRLEQAFSADGGKSWEANWIAEFRRRTSGT